MSGNGRRATPAATATWAVLCLLFGIVLHWNQWAALAIAAGCAIIAGFISLAIQDTWPPPVPPGLAGGVTRLRADGWRVARVHPWWQYLEGKCPEAGNPHVHMVSPEGHPVLIADAGTQAVTGSIADEVTRMERDGWVIERRHPLYCHLSSRHWHLIDAHGNARIISGLDAADVPGWPG